MNEMTWTAQNGVTHRTEAYWHDGWRNLPCLETSDGKTVVHEVKCGNQPVDCMACLAGARW